MTTVGTPISSLANGTIFSQVTVEARGALVNAAVPAQGVSVTVYIHEPGYLPTSNSTQASVFSDEFLTVLLAQPLTSDVNGQIPGYVAPGQLLDAVATGGPLGSEQVLFLNTQASASVLSGTATLIAGTITIANAAITANSLIRLTRMSAAGTVGILGYVNTPSTGFAINSYSGTGTALQTSDTSKVFWEIVNY